MVLYDQYKHFFSYNWSHTAINGKAGEPAMSFMHLLYSPAEIARNTGQNAKALRLSKNLSRRTLAEKSGVSETTIKRFEMTGVVTFEALILLATALDERAAVTRLFNPEHPNSVDELKNAKRKRGMR